MNAHSTGVVQSLASQNNIPASLISSALINANVAASISASTSQAGGKCTCVLHVWVQIQTVEY